jgi:hypothetical protein
MRVVEPGRPLVVEVGQSAFFEDRGGLRADRDNAVGKSRHHLRHPLDEIGRVEPSLAQLVKPARRLGNRNSARIVGYSAAGWFGVNPSGKGKVSKVVEGV